MGAVRTSWPCFRAGGDPPVQLPRVPLRKALRYPTFVLPVAAPPCSPLFLDIPELEGLGKDPP